MACSLLLCHVLFRDRVVESNEKGPVAVLMNGADRMDNTNATPLTLRSIDREGTGCSPFTSPWAYPSEREFISSYYIVASSEQWRVLVRCTVAHTLAPLTGELVG